MVDMPGEQTPITISRATNADILQTVVQMRIDMTGTFARLIEQVGGLSERLAKLEGKFDAQIRLGAEQEAQNRVTRESVIRLEGALDDAEQRLRELERFRWQASAIGAAAGFFGGLLWELVVSRLF